MVGLGSIIIVNNLIFENMRDHKKYVDHAFSRGRPCVVLHFDKEKIYFVPLSCMNENVNLQTHVVFCS